MSPPFLRPSYALPLRLINTEPRDTQIGGVLRHGECPNAMVKKTRGEEPTTVPRSVSPLKVDELVALVGDHAVARAAFDEAQGGGPAGKVTLRQKTRLLFTSERDAN